jgi:hypothetical protein
MRNIIGIVKTELDFRSRWIGNLLEYEGPLLSLYEDTDHPDTYYLHKWVDHDNNANRWVVVPMSLAAIHALFHQQTTFRQVILQADHIHLVDFDQKDNALQVLSIDIADLPDAYLPMQDSFYSESIYTEFAENFFRDRSRAGPPDNSGKN